MTKLTTEKIAPKLYAELDKSGYPVAFFRSDINKNIPKSALPITAAEHQDMIDHPGVRRIVDGKVITATEKQTSMTMDVIRMKRNGLLAQSDWTQLTDAPLTDKEKEKWAAYRQDLRDLPQNYPDPENIIWPDAPGESA